MRRQTVGPGRGTPAWATGLEADGSAPAVDFRAAVLVEGTSDQLALEALARRRDRDLGTEGVAIVPIGGAMVIGRALEWFGARAPDVRLAGLCDVAEEGYFRRGLARAGLGDDLSRAEMAALGFCVCVADLEDELIRALGADRVEQVIEARGELGPFRTFQKQPAQRPRTVEQQLHRFMGTRSGRKRQYAAALVGALHLDRVPQPLDAVLAHVP